MGLEMLSDRMGDNQTVKWRGDCHDCGSEVCVITERTSETEIQITGGALYDTENDGVFFKCDACFAKDRKLHNYRAINVYSRVVGYLTPINQWNDGKRAEFHQRKMFKVEESVEEPTEKPTEESMD